MNAITTRRTLARYFAAPPAIRRTIDVVSRPPVAARFVAPPPLERQPAISTEVWGYVATFLVGSFFGAWLMGMAG
jgi:hypothetical protein